MSLMGFSYYDLFPILVQIRLHTPRPELGSWGVSEDPILGAVLDLVALGLPRQQAVWEAVVSNRAVLSARVGAWVKKQTPETLQQRRQEAMRRLEAENPRQRMGEGFDYDDEYMRTLKAFGVFKSDQDDAVAPGCDKPDEAPSLRHGGDAESGANPAGGPLSQAGSQEVLPRASRSSHARGIGWDKDYLDDRVRHYFDMGLGGGASVDHIVHATLDLLDQGVDREVSVNLGMHCIHIWLHSLAEQWEQGIEPLRHAVYVQRSESEGN